MLNNQMVYVQITGTYNLVGGAITILKKYEFVNGKDDIPYMKWKIKNCFFSSERTAAEVGHAATAVQLRLRLPSNRQAYPLPPWPVQCADPKETHQQLGNTCWQRRDPTEPLKQPSPWLVGLAAAQLHRTLASRRYGCTLRQKCLPLMFKQIWFASSAWVLSSATHFPSRFVMFLAPWWRLKLILQEQVRYPPKRLCQIPDA